MKPKYPKTRPRYVIWSVRSLTSLALLVVGLTAGLVFWLGNKPLFVETELTLAFIAAALFMFLAVGLYRGVRVRRRDVPATAVTGVSLSDMNMDWTDGIGDIDGFDIGEGCFGAIIGLLLFLFGGLILIFVLWLLINLGLALWVFLLAALGWVFYRALRVVFVKSRFCKGDWAKSVGYALLYTALYTGWLFALVWAAHKLFGHRLPAAPVAMSALSDEPTVVTVYWMIS